MSGEEESDDQLTDVSRSSAYRSAEAETDPLNEPENASNNLNCPDLNAQVLLSLSLVLYNQLIDCVT